MYDLVTPVGVLKTPIAMFLVISIAMMTMANRGKADALGDFQTGYPAAEAKLEEQYKNVQLTAICTSFDGNRKVQEIQNVEETRSGDFIRSISTSILSNRKLWPAGSTGIEGGSAKKYFTMAREAGKPFFQITYVGAAPKLAQRLMVAFPLLTRSFATKEGNLAEFFRSKNVTMKNAIERDETVEIIAEDAQPLLKRVYHFTFSKGDFRLLQYTCEPSSQPVIEGIVQYDTSVQPPTIKSCEEWVRNKPGTGKKFEDVLYEVTSLTFVKTPLQKFTPDATISDSPPAPAATQPSTQPAVGSTSRKSNTSLVFATLHAVNIDEIDLTIGDEHDGVGGEEDVGGGVLISGDWRL